MNIKTVSLLIVTMAVIAFSFAVLPSTSHNVASMEATAFSTQSSVYNGSITILPNGQLSLQNTSAASPFTHSGDYYNLTENVNGTLMIEKTGAIVNGNGFSMYNNSTSQPIVNITEANNVDLNNLHIASTSTGGIMVRNASHVSLNELNLTIFSLGIAVEENTHYVNVSNSVITMGNDGYFNFLGIGMGMGNFGFPAPTTLSSNNSIFNDTISMYDAYFGAFLIGSNNTVAKNDRVSVTNGAFISSIIAANNTMVKGLNMTGSAEYGLVVTTSSGGASKNNTLEDSSFNFTDPSTSGTSEGIAFQSSGTISGNNIKMSGKSDGAYGIFSPSSNLNITDNSIRVSNTNGKGNTSGIFENGSNALVTGNSISVSGNNSFGIQVLNGTDSTFSSNYANLSGINTTGISESGNSTDSMNLDGNSIYLNGTGTVNGIELNGSNQTIRNNLIVPYTGTSVVGITGYTTNASAYYNLNILENNLSFIHDSSANMKTGISLHSSHSIRDASITGNLISFDSSSQIGMSLANFTHSTVSSNNILFTNGYAEYGMLLMDFKNSTVSDNYLNGYGSLASGVSFNGGNYLTVARNIVTGFAGSYFIDMANNTTFFGNTGNDSFDPIGISDSSNVTVYHNDFTYYYDAPVYLQNPKNIKFNLSYPIGGNYWNSYIGGGPSLIDIYSGPNQNIPGSDGINDSAFNLGSGYADYYPLMKPWINPQAVFGESGLLSGSSWSVTFNGMTKVSTGNEIVFDIVNGTYQNYSYTVHTTNGYTGGGESGVFSYMGDNSFNLNSTFAPLYTFKIAETGLPAGTSWNVTVNGTVHTLTTGSISFLGTNGTKFSYSFENTTLYYTAAAGGSATMNGKNVTVSVEYKHWAYITGNFSQAGVNVTLNGKKIGTGSFSFNESVPAGTYRVVVSGNGYVTKYNNFTLNPGQSMNISTTLNAVKKNTPFPMTYIYAIAGGVVVVALIGGVYYFFRLRKS